MNMIFDFDRDVSKKWKGSGIAIQKQYQKTPVQGQA